MTWQDIESIGKIVAALGAAGGIIFALAKYVAKPVRAASRAVVYFAETMVPEFRGMQEAFGSNIGQTQRNMLDQLSKRSSIAEMQRDLIAQHLNLGAFLCTPDGKCTYANSVLQDMFGIGETRMNGFGWLEAIAEDQRQEVHRVWTNSIANGLPYSDHYTVVNQRTGRRYKVKATARPITADGGDVVTAYVGWITQEEPGPSPLA